MSLKDLVRNVSSAEVVITRAQSLLSKLSPDSEDAVSGSAGSAEPRSTTDDLRGFVSDLLEQPEVSVIGAARAPLGVIVHRLFINSLTVSAASCVDRAVGGASEEGVTLLPSRLYGVWGAS